MDFYDGLAIFQFVILTDRGAGQLALFADRHKADTQLVRDGPAKDKTARLKANDLVDALARVGVQHLVNGHTKPAGVGKQGGDIAKHDPFVREIDDGSDVISDRLVSGHGQPLLRQNTLGCLAQAGWSCKP